MKLLDIGHINEGGTATEQYGAGRIKREDIPGTIKYVSDLLSIPRQDLHIIGSTTKIADSGDIDLGVDLNKYNPEHIDKVLKAHGYNGKYNKSTKVGSYSVPVKGEKGKGYVQVDFMFTTNPDWAKFAYHSAGEGSRYKGAVRTVLLSAAAAVINEPGTDYFEHQPDGELTARVGRSLDLHQGLVRKYQYRPKKVSGEGYLKAMKSVSPEEFATIHPGVNVKTGKMLQDKPEQVVKAIFGKGVTPEDVQSAEQVLHLIKSRFTPEVQKKIFKIAAARLKSQAGKVRLPPEVEAALGKTH